MKNNSGALFRNRKEAADKKPDFTGNATIDGKIFRLSAWVNKSQSGLSYLRLVFAEPQETKSDPPELIEPDDLAF